MRFIVAGVAIARHAGADRYATAAALSAASYAPGVPVVYVSTGATFPDALAAGPAAAKLGGPVLLVATNRIPSATATELRRLRPGRIIVAGGPGVVSSTVLNGLRSYTGSVSRQAGSDRFSTAAAVSAATFARGVPVVYVATGHNFPDALAGGPASGMHGGPVLLVDTHTIPAATARELQRLKPTRIVVAGGTAAVSNAVLSALRAYATTVSRQSGSDRYATAVAISLANHKAGAAGVVYIATSRTFPDALAAAPIAGRDRGPVLLVSPTSLPGSVAAELQRLSPNRVVIVGGTSTVSDAVVRAIRTAIGS
jgi:putative cell wall-binding protein